MQTEGVTKFETMAGLVFATLCAGKLGDPLRQQMVLMTSTTIKAIALDLANEAAATTSEHERLTLENLSTKYHDMANELMEAYGVPV